MAALTRTINPILERTGKTNVQVVTACEADIPAWLALASQVEDLFGVALSSDESFNAALRRNIRLGTAFCVRAGDGPPGSALLGGLLFSDRHRPVYTLGWFAVEEGSRRLGVGHALVAYALARVEPPAEVVVTTFVPGAPGAEPARKFYLKEGFKPAEFLVEDGACRQRFRKKVNS